MASTKTLVQQPSHEPAASSLVIDARQLLIVLSGVSVVSLAIFLTTIPYGRSIWDFLFLLDGAYRISLGQTPHIDFASPVGSLSLYLTFAAEHLFPRGNAFVGLHALAWLSMLPIAALLAPRFQSHLGFVAALALLALMTLIPITADSTHLSEISYFASYNRFASGLLFLVGLWYVLPKSRNDGLLLACILTVLFFLKITAAIVAAGVIIAAVVLGRASLRVLLTTLMAFAVVLLAINATSDLVTGYVHDVRSMSATNQGRAVYALFFAAFRNWSVLAVVAGITAVAVLSVTKPLNPSLQRPFDKISALLRQEAFAVDACLLVAAALFAESQNTGGLGLIAAAAILFHLDAWKGRPPRTVGVTLLMAALLLPVIDTVIKRGATEFTRSREKASDQSLNELIPGTRVAKPAAEGARLFERMTTEWLDFARAIQHAGFFIDPDPTSNSSAVRLAWAKSAVEAGRAFKAHGYHTMADRYATLAFADPFARMLHLTPATGTTIAIEVGRTMPILTAEGASRYLADANGVFVDRCEIGPNVTNDAAFQTVLDREFEKLPLHRCWDFYRRLTASQHGRGS